MNEPRSFSAHPLYRILFIVCTLLTALFAWSLGSTLAHNLRMGGTLAWSVAEWGALFFLVIMLALSIWTMRQMFSRVELTPAGVTLFAPLLGEHHVDFRQCMGVSEGGRIGRSLTLLYHPVGADGLLDLDSVQSLTLPNVRDQETLIEHLREKIA